MSNNLRKKALFPAIAMVLVSVIALSGVTYAWFTTSNTATVSSLDVNVQSASGIQISLNAVDWKSSIKGADIIDGAYDGHQNAYPTNTNAEIMPVSTVGNISNTGLMEMFLGTLTATDGLMTEAQTDKNNTNYIAFDLFFKIDQDDVEISLDMSGDNGSKVVNTGDVRSASSARVAFVNYGASDDATTAKNDFAVNKLDDGSNDIIIWEPNSTVSVDGNTQEKKDYQGVKAEVADAFADGADALGDVETVDFAKRTEGEGTALFTLEKGINKVRVYIWMEGQDPDCTNDASGGAFSTILKFSRPAEETIVA